MYALLDYGFGRKLEQFGPYILDRPAPAVEQSRPQRPELWSRAHSRFIRGENLRGVWEDKTTIPRVWTVQINGISFCLKRTPVGHLGIFPEQSDNWRWIRKVTRPEMRILNLFAYTGGSSIAAASRDSSVVVAHVDSAANTVQWARSNAEQTVRDSQTPLAIRWIQEDASKFVSRELKRGHHYDGIILDPPSYGHGSKGEIWEIGKELPVLLKKCLELSDGSPSYILLTAHSPDFTRIELSALAKEALGSESLSSYKIETGAMRLRAPEIKPFDCGEYIRIAKKNLLNEV